MRNLGLWRSFGHVFGSGLANELLDRLFPAPPTWRERFLDKFTESMLAVLPYVVERMAPPDPKPAAKPAEAAPPIPIRVPPPYKVLGLFTCPKCGGHTWGWTGEQGRDENGTYIRACRNRCAGHNPLTGYTECGFTWKATEDHLYFAPPTADDQKRSEPQTCAPPPRWSPEDEAVQVAISKEWPSDTPPPIDVLRMDLASLRSIVGSRIEPDLTLIGAAAKLLRENEDAWFALYSAVGERRIDGETTVHAAVRLLAEADAYIAKQAEQIRGLILDNEFGEDCGEFGVRLSLDDAAAIGFPNYAGQVVPIVINDGHWSVRVGTNLYPVKAPGPDRKAPAPTLGTGSVLQWATFALDHCDCHDAITGAVAVGGKTLVPADAQLVAAQEAAKRSVVGGKVTLQESVEVAAFVDDAEKEKQERKRASEEANRRWQEYARRAGEEKYDAADKQIDETEMAQNAAGGVA